MAEDIPSIPVEFTDDPHKKHTAVPLHNLETSSEITSINISDIPLNDASDLVSTYLNNEIPPTEPRIQTPMNPNCKLSLVVPAYAEGLGLLNLFTSLANQKDISSTEFEVCVVVNNPPQELVPLPNEDTDEFNLRKQRFDQACLLNQLSNNLIKYINGDTIDIKFTPEEEEKVETIKKSGIIIHCIDKATPGNTLPVEQANVGGARNRGLAEAVERFSNIGRNGIVAHTDADTVLSEHYIRNLIDIFNEHSDIIAVGGIVRLIEGNEANHIKDGLSPDQQELFERYEILEYEYDNLLRKIATNQPTKNETVTPEKNSARFLGASIATRAFEAAQTGGIPKVKGGEDGGFINAISSLNKGRVVSLEDPIVQQEIGTKSEVIAQAEKRFTGRAEIGQAVRWNELLSNIKSGLTPQVRNPEHAILIQGISQKVKDLMVTDKVTQQSLGIVYTNDGLQLLSNASLEKLVDSINNGTFEISQQKDIEREIAESLIKAGLPEKVSITEAVDTLQKHLINKGVSSELFNRILSELLEQEETKLANRRILLEGIIKRAFDYKKRSGNNLSSFFYDPTSLGLEKAQYDTLHDSGYLSTILQTVSESDSIEHARDSLATRYSSQLNLTQTTVATLKINAMKVAMNYGG